MNGMADILDRPFQDAFSVMKTNTLFSFNIHELFFPLGPADDTSLGKSNDVSGLILGLRLANERRRYFVTASLIGWAQA